MRSFEYITPAEEKKKLEDRYKQNKEWFSNWFRSIEEIDITGHSGRINEKAIELHEDLKLKENGITSIA